MRLYIFRHGLATKSTTGYGNEIEIARLLPDGIPAIEKLAEYLKNTSSDFNVSSEFIRCRETVEIVSKITGKQFTFDKRLNEFYNETTETFITRVKDFLTEIKTKQYIDIGICTHAGVIAVILKILKNEPIAPEDLYTNYPLPGVLLTVTNEEIIEKDFN